MTNFHTIVAKRLRERRLAAGIALKRAAAERIGVAESRYNNYERAYRIPNYETLTRLGQLYKTNPAYFLGWTEDPEPVHPFH